MRTYLINNANDRREAAAVIVAESPGAAKLIALRDVCLKPPLAHISSLSALPPWHKHAGFVEPPGPNDVEEARWMRAQGLAQNHRSDPYCDRCVLYQWEQLPESKCYEYGEPENGTSLSFCVGCEAVDA